MSPEERMKKYVACYGRVSSDEINITHVDGWYKVNSYFYNTAGEIDQIIAEMEGRVTASLRGN